MARRVGSWGIRVSAHLLMATNVQLDAEIETNGDEIFHIVLFRSRVCIHHGR